jgi:hypothetical protein
MKHHAQLNRDKSIQECLSPCLPLTLCPTHSSILSSDISVSHIIPRINRGGITTRDRSRHPL